VKEALRARLADVVDALSEIDALVEGDADRPPPLVMARVLVEAGTLTAQLARLRQALADAAGKPMGSSTPRNAPAGG
jgi:hypothetical protein